MVSNSVILKKQISPFLEAVKVRQQGVLDLPEILESPQFGIGTEIPGSPSCCWASRLHLAEKRVKADNIIVQLITPWGDGKLCLEVHQMFGSLCCMRAMRNCILNTSFLNCTELCHRDIGIYTQQDFSLKFLSNVAIF